MMKKSLYRRAALAGLTAIVMLPAGAAVAPAAAQIGGIVHDPRNYAQNILPAARTLEQRNNQNKQLQNQATSQHARATCRERCVSTGRSTWSAYHYKKKYNKTST